MNRPRTGFDLPQQVTLHEVGPRDGLQRLEPFIPSKTKIETIRRLAGSGLKQIQVASFVHPRVVPQMADAEAVCRALPEGDKVRYTALVLNMRGLERAHAAGIRFIESGAAASDAFSRRNAGYSREEGMARMPEIVERAHSWGIQVRLHVQVAFGCPLGGNVGRQDVLTMVEAYLEMGADEVALADSAGLGDPAQVYRASQAALALAGDIPVALHLHDTRGQGMANLLAGLLAGVTHFDTAFGGLGGCPFIPQARGNVATEDAASMLHAMGVQTGVNVAQLAAVSRETGARLGVEIPARLPHLVNP